MDRANGLAPRGLAWRLSRVAGRLSRGILVLIACLLVLELGLRLYVLRWNAQLREAARSFRADAATGYALAPNRSTSVPPSQGAPAWRFDTNAQGLRGPDLAPRSPGECRLVMLGASYTYGVGVEATQAAPALLEAHLRESSAHPVRVINAGTPAFGLTEQLEQYRSRGAGLDVDGVILPYLQRDDLDGLRHFKLVDGMLFTDPLLIGGHPSFLLEFFSGDNIYVHRSYEVLQHLFKHVLPRRAEDVVPRRATTTFDPATKSWEVIQQIAQLARSRRQPFLLANFPFWEKSGSFPGADPARPASAKTPEEPWARDYFPVFWNLPSTPFLEGDHHWNELGHRLVADAVFPWANDVCQGVWSRESPAEPSRVAP